MIESETVHIVAAPTTFPQVVDDATDDMDRFASRVAHDFSGPLRAIRGFAGLLDDVLCERINAEERAYLTEIITASERMQAVNDGLITCIRARRAPLEFTEVSLDAVVRHCVSGLAARIAERGARVTAAALPTVTADARSMALLFHHLLDNALRYADPDRESVIEIAASSDDTDWTIVVRDNGPGIAEANRERVFTLFKRLEPARDAGRPGVGLTLCATIVARHGGRLWINPAAGGGTEATFTLPVNGTAATAVRPDRATGDGVADAAERRQLDRHAALAAIVDSSDDAILSKDLDGVIVTWNRAAETLYGFTAEEAIGRHVSMLMPPDRLDELRTLMDAIRAGTLMHLETIRKRSDGSLIDVSLTVSPIRDARGDIIAASVIARDITERHRAEGQLRAFLEVAPDAIVVIDRQGAINDVNTQAEAIFGYARAEMIGQPLEMLLPERYRQTHLAQRMSFTTESRKRMMGTGLELYGLRHDGTEFPVDIQLSRLPTEDGMLPVAAIRDVTERRRLEHLRDDFIGNAAHELRTPLTTLAGLGETLARSYDVMDRADIEDAFAAMSRQGERARVLIANLLDLSNVEGGRATFTIGPVAVEPLVGRVLEAAPPPDGSTITVNVQQGIRVQADPSRLEQVITNLLVNAYRYGGSNIRVEALPQDGRVLLTVADDGAGVAPDLVDKLFEPFTRGREANAVRGSGIGLALCRRIVQGMEGEIWHQTLSPRGSSFHVSLRREP